MIKKYCFFLFLFFCVNSLRAQENNIFSNYYTNSLYNNNPAASGFDGSFVTQLSFAKQWVGINGAPTKQILCNSIRLGEEEFYDQSMHVNRPFINLNNRIGLGFTLYNYIEGPLRLTGFMFAYAYHIPIHSARLSFGLSGMLTQYSLSTAEFKPISTDDPALYNNTSVILPNINCGTMLYSPEYFMGISANGLLNGNNTLNNRQSNPYLLVCGGYKIKANRFITLEPALFLNKQIKGNMEYSIHGKIYFKQQSWLVLAYHNTHAMDAGLGFVYKQAYQLCYIYTLSTGSIAGYNYGSHQVALRMNIEALVKSKNK
jgi:type IX secretion system PorP/SprF family membrane protein